MVNNYAFTILEGDERRVLLVHAELAEAVRARWVRFGGVWCWKEWCFGGVVVGERASLCLLLLEVVP